MSRVVSFVLSLVFALGISGKAAAQDVSGSWITYNFGPPAVITLMETGSRVAGIISRPEDAIQISEGTRSGATVTFKAVSPTTEREVTFVGRLSGDEIAFTRDVRVLPGGASVGTGIFG